MIRIAFVITEQMLVTGFTSPYELFFAASQAAKNHSGNDDIDNDIQLITVGKKAGNSITSPAKLDIPIDKALSKEKYDLIYLPALWRNPRPIVRKNPEIVEWLRWQFEHGAIINSVGTSVCFIAEAGLLDQKPATTHWHYFEQFSKDYPLVELKRQHFITAAGNIYCAASINSLMDLTIHHVHRFFNQRVSQHVERNFSHEVRQSFDKVSYFQEENTNHPDEKVLQIQLWMQGNLSKPMINIQELAKRFGLSPRNLNRRFKQATNMTPVNYLKRCRLTTARDLLQSSSLPISEIAFRVGYQDVSYFSKMFRQETSITPREYRASVRAKLYDTNIS